MVTIELTEEEAKSMVAMLEGANVPLKHAPQALETLKKFKEAK